MMSINRTKTNVQLDGYKQMRIDAANLERAYDAAKSINRTYLGVACGSIKGSSWGNGGHNAGRIQMVF